jgi:predicted phage gp36 major capsid-like protein
LADRYIDREALIDQETVRAETTLTSDQVSRENTRLRENLASMTEKMSQMNALMSVIATDPAVAQMLAQKIRQLGQGERLSELRAQNRRASPEGGNTVPSELLLV